ncbi:hypothetical protein [uncultured Roseibium sp.]|uniref:hypothetical protein n=1 Tax=uncultured Roseibium sp. TaxID=1936171 RepID=UPI0025976B04|nr:hypothetical protein [uncultured Roseibium sp.]
MSERCIGTWQIPVRRQKNPLADEARTIDKSSFCLAFFGENLNPTYVALGRGSERQLAFAIACLAFQVRRLFVDGRPVVVEFFVIDGGRAARSVAEGFGLNRNYLARWPEFMKKIRRGLTLKAAFQDRILV